MGTQKGRENKKNFAYSVYDIHSRVVVQDNGLTNSTTIENLAKGLCFVHIRSGKHIRIEKIRVE